MYLSLWIFLLCRLWLCSCSCKGHSSWVWSLRLCIALFCRCCIPTWFICPWFSGESREGKKCTEVRGKGEAEGWAGMRSRWISAGLTSHPLCGSGGWQGCSGRGSRRLRSRDAVPGQGSSSGSSWLSGKAGKACTGEMGLAVLISQARIKLWLFWLGVWSWERALGRAALGALAGPQLWGGRGRASTEANAECLNEAAVNASLPWGVAGRDWGGAEGSASVHGSLPALPSKSTRVFPWVVVGGWHEAASRDHLIFRDWAAWGFQGLLLEVELWSLVLHSVD